MDLSAIQSLVDSHPLAVTLALIWVIVWKGLALWRAAERRARGWFIAILAINTLGLLEIVYLFFVSKPVEPGVPAKHSGS